MNRFRGELLTALLVLGGCSASAPDGTLGCRDDVDCEDNGQVCFIDGCGDPGKNIVVEVVPNAKEGLFAQDVAVEALGDQLALDLSGPSALRGQVRVRSGASTAGYSAPVTLRITGESLLLPGVPRWQGDSKLDLDPEGTYAVTVASGRYTVKLLTPSTNLPPQSATREVRPGSTELLDFLLPAASELVQLPSLVLRADGRPPDPDVPLEVQLLDETQAPLTQRVAVAPGTGAFQLTARAADLVRDALTLQVTSSNPLMPQLLFHLDPRKEPRGPFLLPDSGEPVKLQGRVVGPDGRPVAGATLSISGQVLGGGLYRGPQVQSRSDGTFELTTLPSPTSGTSRELRLAITPQAGAGAGATETSLLVPRVSVWQLGDVKCQARRQVEGTLLGPIGSRPAGGVQVEALLLKELADLPRPAASRVAAPHPTDDQGRFELALDPGIYRFDFTSPENLPRYSRIVTVRPWTASSPAQPQDVSTPLLKGRRVTGLVRFGEPDARLLAPNAALRFYRRVGVEGQPSALLLGETTTDASGAFSTTLPLP